MKSKTKLYLTLFLAIVLLGTHRVTAQNSAYNEVLGLLKSQGYTVPARSTLVVRIDEGVGCSSCYARQFSENDVLAACLSKTKEVSVLFVRLLAVRRLKDFSSRKSASLDKKSALVPDVSQRVSSQLMKLSNGSTDVVLYYDGSISNLSSVLNHCGHKN